MFSLDWLIEGHHGLTLTQCATPACNSVTQIRKKNWTNYPICFCRSTFSIAIISYSSSSILKKIQVSYFWENHCSSHRKKNLFFYKIQYFPEGMASFVLKVFGNHSGNSYYHFWNFTYTVMKILSLQPEACIQSYILSITDCHSLYTLYLFCNVQFSLGLAFTQTQGLHAVSLWFQTCSDELQWS